MPSPLCAKAEDLYTPAASRAIEAHLEGWLTRHLATPFELLHRPDLALKLEASGSDLQQAVQKVAVPAAVAGAGSVHEVIRGLHRAIDQGLSRLQRAKRERAIAPLTPDRLGQAGPLSEPEERFAFGLELAAALAGAEIWAEKLDKLLDLAEAAAALGDEAKAALGVLEQPLRSLLALPASRTALFGEGLELGCLLLAQLALAEGAAFEAVARVSPAMAANARPLHPTLTRLAANLSRGVFPGLRRQLGRETLAAFAGRRRLRPAEPAAEIDTLRLLATTLTAAAGPDLPEDDVREAIVARSRLLVEPDFLGALIGAAPDPFVEFGALVLVLENVAGDANRRRAVRLLHDTLATRRLLRALSETPAREAALRGLAQMRQRVARAGAQVAGLEAVLETLDQLQAAHA
jgi:hypothetical protein